MAYPISNRRAGLTVDYFSIRRQVGVYLEIGLAHELWDDEQAEVVDDIIRDGLSLYYHPPVLTEPYAIGATEPHEWSFMRPTWTFKTQDDQRRVPLPEDFDRPISDLTYPDSTDSGQYPIQFTSPAKLRALEYQDDWTSYPRFAAIEPLETQGDSPQTLVLVLHPTPSGVFTLSLIYQSNGRMISSDHPYPMGGQIHGPGITQACVAVAEFVKTGESGPMYERFMGMLAANVSRDYHRGGRILGYNGNSLTSSPSGRAEVRRLDGLFYDTPLVQGTDYSG